MNCCLEREIQKEGRLENPWNFKCLNPSSFSEVRCLLLLGSYCPGFRSMNMTSSSLCHWANQWLPALLICKPVVCLLCISLLRRTWAQQSVVSKWLPFGPWVTEVCLGRTPRSIFSECLYIFSVSLGFLPPWISQLSVNTINWAEVDLNFMQKTTLLQTTTIFFMFKKSIKI